MDKTKLQKIEEIIKDAEKYQIDNFFEIEKNSLLNTQKVLDAFCDAKISSNHFAPTTGYGYNDIGREKLCDVFAKIFSASKAIVSPFFASGTHAIVVALFGLLRPNDLCLSITGDLYDTIKPIVEKKDIGSLKDFGINFDKVELDKNFKFNKKSIESKIKENKPKVVYIQRSGGYTGRDGLKVSDIIEISKYIKTICDCFIFVDNCYGEFVDIIEPCDGGYVDCVVGSFIKNVGGGIAPTGGYVAGTSKALSLIEGRLTVPNIGMEIGSYVGGYQRFFQGLFFAPHIVSQAIKTSLLFGTVFKKLGYQTLPSIDTLPNDLVRTIKLWNRQKLIDFCNVIQKNSPIDSFVNPIPDKMPGYDDEIIMAAGTFVSGASIELSADAPIREPYNVYLQGGLVYEHSKIALMRVLEYFV